MKHHCKLVIICSFDDIGYPITYKKLQEFTNIQQEEIVLYIIDTPETSLMIYEQMLNNLYSLASHTSFVVVFDRFNPQFKLDKFDLTINLGTKHEGDFNFPLNTKHEVRNIDFKEGIQCNSYQRAANGGTFDHLHFGHKILLSVSLLAVKQHLTIGVTGEALLKNKKHVAFLQSYNTRVRCVKEFCSIFRPEIDLFFSELIEPAGPTKNGIYECLIATEETASSLEYINSLRVTQGLNKLEGYIIKLIGNQAQKLSSTDIRNQISRVNRLSDQEYLELKTQWLKVSPDLYWFESIIADYYSQPHRHYHTLRHIYDMVKQLKTQNQILAAFFHDVIYYPKIHDNEERSALLFQQYAKEVSIDSEIVSIFILQTKQHSIDVPFLQENDLSELMEFLDADLSILESPTYAIYAQDIRLEYAHYPDQEYKTGRIAVLQKFLNKKLFYLRDDGKAKKNILEEIEALQNWKV